MAPGIPPALRDKPYPGSQRFIAVAQDCPCLTGHELLVLLALTRSDPRQTGVCSPSLGTLAADARMARSTAKETVRTLVGLGWVRVERRTKDDGKASSSSEITLFMPSHDAATCPRCVADAEDDRGRNTPGGAIRPRAGSDRGRNTPRAGCDRGRGAPGGSRASDLLSDSGSGDRISDSEEIRIPPCPPSGGTAPDGTNVVSSVVDAIPPTSRSLPSSDAEAVKQVAGEQAAAGRAPPAEKVKRVRAPRGERTAAPRKTPMPEGWAPLPAHFVKGLELGLNEADVRLEAELFASRTASKGLLYVDWNAAFRNHLGMEAKFALKRKADAEATAAQSGGVPAADRIPEAEILQAYADGIVAAVGGTFVCEPRHLQSLRAMFKGHARDAQGEKVGPTGTLAWIKETATTYRRSVADEPAKFQGGYNPPACMNWLNSGRPLARASPRSTAQHAPGRFTEQTARAHGMAPVQSAQADDTWD